MKTIMWTKVKWLKEQIKWFFEYQEEASEMWIWAVTEYNPALEDLIKWRMWIGTYRNEVKNKTNLIINK